MKKGLWLFVMLCLCLVLAAAPGQKNDDAKRDANSLAVTKTYELKNVSPRSIESIINPYILQLGKEMGNQIMVVTLYQSNVKAFEDLIARLDLPKKAIRFRIFTVIASNRADAKTTEMHEDLKGVVDEIRTVLGYKSYTLDGVSTLTVSDGSDYNKLILNSKIDDLELGLKDVSLARTDDGQAFLINSGMSLVEVFGGVIVEKDRQVINRSLMIVERMQLKEGGYLVAGVSRLGEGSDALVLVINATVK